MTFLIIVLLLITIVTLSEHNSTSNVHSGLVYKGKRFKMVDYPYVMYVKSWHGPPEQERRPYGSCTGTLVNKLFVLTAGHCCIKTTEMEVSIIKLHFNCIFLYILSSTKTF